MMTKLMEDDPKMKESKGGWKMTKKVKRTKECFHYFLFGGRRDQQKMTSVVEHDMKMENNQKSKQKPRNQFLKKQWQPQGRLVPVILSLGPSKT